MQNLKVALIQTYLHWESPSKNRKHFDNLMVSISGVDLILLPEMFSTGFTMKSEQLAETMNGETIRWMRQKAEEKKAVVCGSLIIQERENYFNRLVWMRPDGSLETYDKRHLFRMADEHDFFSAGKSQLIVELKGWEICPLICYDLRFPVWSRNRFETTQENQLEASYDLLLYIANWPEARVKAWEKLLFARAIENQCYVLGLNRIGQDGKGVNYSGCSIIIDAKGEEIQKATDHQEEIMIASLAMSDLEEFRDKFPVGLDADGFKII